ncbi:MAG: mevalonate kinase [Candidatus Nezhaarchaeota archaeon]|nr:mevalonate kinase [Candidatus Nezhaarchaeota archaeon]MCX8142347.1 mevalonate kinase [Candidatus Nezhaarchaeota archaeon]MDW8050680.1 mevalonate kinase [Nitrososphaerota archaeon]
MVIVSAPGKVTLFGEHAVVYGEPAIAMAIDKRVRVEAVKRTDEVIRIEAKDLVLAGFRAVIASNGSMTLEGESRKVLAALSYVKKAVELVQDRYGIRHGAHLSITSEMPVGAGLGTSAAVAVSVVKAYSAICGVELSEEECATLGHQVELAVQGMASKMDTTTTAIGGVLYIDPKREKVYERIEHPSNLRSLVIGYVNRESSTSEMVDKVRRLRSELPGVVDLIIKIMGEITRRARSCIESGNLSEIGLLMNVNHGLLEAIGVSTTKLSQMVYAARLAGALGSKITGAGGGGCIVALAPGREEEVIAALKAIGASAFKANPSSEGVKIEEG